jgi:uncharacterized protein (TIGR03382 family)
MSGYERSDYRPSFLPTGIGCSFVLPTALVGIGLLADFEGPGDWRSLAELAGWIALCAGASIWCAFLLAQFRRDTRSSYLFPFASLGSAVVFMMLVIREAHPATPLWLKEAYTTGLQVVGVGAVATALMAGVGWLVRRRS